MPHRPTPPATPRRPRRSSALVLLSACAVSLLLGLGLARRLQVVSEYRNFAGDGWQYYHLAQNLVGSGRYAFGPPPQPLAWSRLPGYPLFVAATGLPAPRFNDADVGSRVAHAQAFLDAATALFAFLLAGELGLRLPRFLALALCAASPFLALATSYILSETLATFLTTATLWLLLRGARTRLSLHLALAGALLALGLLCRADAVTLAPAFLVPLVASSEKRAGKARAAALAALAFALVFAPWPLRNLSRFHSPHTLGSAWVTRNGDPLPMGVQAWLRTWAVEPRAAADVAWTMTRSNPIYTSALPADAFDSPAERKQVGALLDRYDREGLISPAVDEGFERLARERRERDRVRYFVTLPLRRARELWLTPVPEWELPATSPTLGLPERREALGRLNRRTLLFAALGLLLAALGPSLSRSSPRLRLGRALAALVALTALARTVALAFVVPGGTQRYQFELLPAVLVLAALALVAPAELLFYRLYPRAAPEAGEAPPARA